jgi:hypothetical protein
VIAWVVALGEGTTVSVVPVAADGTFEAAGASWALVVPGHAVLTPSPDGSGDAVFPAAPDTVLKGIVVEATNGTPVPDLDLHLLAHQRHRFGVDARDLDLGDSVPAGRLRAVARTGRDGRFEVRGLATTERVDVLPASGLWFSGSTREASVSPREARVTVVPAFRVSGRVLADETGDPLPAFQPRIRSSGGNELGFDGKDGAFTMTMPWWGEESAFEVTVTAAAAGREPGRASAWIDRARPTASVELRLRRLFPDGKAGVVFEIAGAAAEFAAQPFDLELREPPGDGAIHQRLSTERVDPTHVRATVPAGRWHLRLRAVDVSREPPDWKGVVDLPAGRETPVRWSVPR